MKAIVLLSLVVALSEATDRLPSFIKPGQCSVRYQPLQSFDRNRFSGRWYKIGGTKNPDIEKAVKCSTMTFRPTDSGMAVIGAGLDEKGEETNPQLNVDILNMADPSVAEFQIKRGSRLLPMDVIATDYDTFACLISCDNIVKSHHTLFAWILNRKPNFDKSVIASCQLALKKARFNVGRLRGTPQGPECPYPN